MTSNIQARLAARLQDMEYRREYGTAQIKADVALLLFEARKAEGLSQKDLAGLIGVSQAYIAKLESGEANPTIGHFGAMLAALWLRAWLTLEFLETPRGRHGVVPGMEPGPSKHEDRVLDAMSSRIVASGVDTCRASISLPSYDGTAKGGNS